MLPHEYIVPEAEVIDFLKLTGSTYSAFRLASNPVCVEEEFGPTEVARDGDYDRGSASAAAVFAFMKRIEADPASPEAQALRVAQRDAAVERWRDRERKTRTGTPVGVPAKSLVTAG